MLSTLKFGLLKHTSEVAFTAAFQEAMDHGMLQGAAQKDILEFVELVDNHPPECTMVEEDQTQTHYDSKHTHQQHSQLTGYDNQGEV